MVDYTLGIRLVLPEFDQNPWDEDVNNNFRLIDSLLGMLYTLPGYRGLWTTATAYAVDDQVLDALTGALYTCAVAHTSGATLAADISGHPTYWDVAVVSPGGALATEVNARTSEDIRIDSNRINAGKDYLTGYNLSVFSTTALTIGIGVCQDTVGTATILRTQAITKLISAVWAAGDSAGGMGNGLTATANTWYHVFAIMPTLSTYDVYFDTSITAANKPVGTVAYRRIGSFRLDGSVHVTPFDQFGGLFMWRTPFAEYGGTPGVTTATTVTLAGIPLGIATEAILTGSIGDATIPAALYISSLTQADVVPGASNGLTGVTGPIGTSTQAYYVRVMTNASQQVRQRVSAVTSYLNMYTNGWFDQRGRG